MPRASAGMVVHDGNALTEGAQVDEFEIIRVLGVGGFGIVYLALDRVLLRYVAVKEYLPTSLAGRGADNQVTVRSAKLADTFTLGLESFINEARMLASFDHPSLVKVFRFWKANGTAYMAMQYYAGQTLKDVRTAMPSPPDEAWLRALLDPILGALDTLHREGVYHRDISPDNILLLPDGRPVVLDFGAARQVIGDRTQTLTAVLKPNFAPIEQYADDVCMKQGAWTDLYALGATIQFVLTNKTPTPAVMRAVRDDVPALSTDECPGVPAGFLAIIDWMMALAPEDRPQSVSSLQDALRGDVAPPPRPARRVVGARPPPQTLIDVPPSSNAGAGADIDPDVDVDPSVYEATRLDPRADVSSVAAPVEFAASIKASIPQTHRGLTWAGLMLTVALTLVGGTAAVLALRPSSSPVPNASALAKAQTTAATSAAAPASVPMIAAAPPDLAAFVASPASAASTASVTASTPNVASTPDAFIATSVTHVPTKSAKADPASHPMRPRPASSPSADRRSAASMAAGHAPPAELAVETPPIAAAATPTLDDRRPLEACAARGFLTRAACFRRECLAPRWRADPLCATSRAAEDAQQQRRGGQF